MPNGAVIAGVIVVLAIGMIAGLSLVWYQPPAPIPVEKFESDSALNPPASDTGIRNCIKSALGNDPDCSDESENALNTYCNGQEIGMLNYAAARTKCR